MREDRQASPTLAPILIRSFDGSRIAVRSAGTEARGAILFVNAVAATLAPWTKVLQGLRPGAPLGDLESARTQRVAPPLTEGLDPATHAADAIAAADHFELDRFAVVAWSNGSRTALELAARFPIASSPWL